jgi:MYXO-CTERM domain-containing protein
MEIKPLFNALLAAAALTLTLATPAQATLAARDLNGDTVTDAFYDTTLYITWLRNANVNGDMDWNSAVAWATGYSFGGYDDWRLPTMVDTGASGCYLSYDGGTDCGYNVQTTSGSTVYSEMASLWYDILGNKAYCPPGDTNCDGGPQTGWGLTNTVDFLNMQFSAYWLGAEYAPDPDYAWLFGTYDGFQSALSKSNQLYVLAVRPGDVRAAQVPEPGTGLLAVAALAGLGVLRRRRAVGPSAL